MKYLIFLGVLLGLYVFGNVLGPSITPLLVDEKKPSNTLKRDVLIAGKGMIVPVNLVEMRDSELPTEVKMTSPVSLPLVGGEGSKELAKGDVVTLKNRNGQMLIIESKDALAKGEVPIGTTDIFEAIAKAKFAEHTEAPTAVTSNGEPKSTPTKPAEETPTPAQPEEKKPEANASNDKKMDPAPKEEPKPAKEKPAPPVAAAKLTPEQIVEEMKASIKGGAVKEFTFDQVQGWKAGPDEEIDGVTYQTGLAAYKAETIFGVKVVQAKALFENAKLSKWIYAKTGMQIR